MINHVSCSTKDKNTNEEHIILVGKYNILNTILTTYFYFVFDINLEDYTYQVFYTYYIKLNDKKNVKGIENCSFLRSFVDVFKIRNHLSHHNV